MNEKTILKILNFDNTEKYFIGKDCLIKTFSDNTVVFIRFKDGEKWVAPENAGSSPTGTGYPFNECSWGGIGKIKQISEEQVFELLL